MSERRVVYLLAGNMREAQSYAVEQCFDVGDSIYISGVEQLQGRRLRREDVRVVGTFWRRPDARVFVETLAQMGVHL